MSAQRLLVATCLSVGLGGCSLQGSAGFSPRSPDAAPRVIDLSGQVEDMREGGPTLGGRGTFTAGNAERPIVFRHAMVDVGYQLRPAEPLGVGVEGGLELGMGEPLFVDFEGLGGYLGGRIDIPMRLYGQADLDRNNYYPAALLLDLVVSGTGGVWTEPAGTATEPALGEAALLLGVRLGIGTDAARSPHPEELESARARGQEGPHGH